MRKDSGNSSNSKSKRTKINKRFLKVTLLFFILYSLFAGYYFNRIYQPWGTCDTDFTVFTRAAADLAQKKDIYAVSYLETGVDFYKYSPAFAFFLIPLSKLHKHISVPIWYLGIFISFMGALFLTKKILLADNQEKVLSPGFYFLAIIFSLRSLLSVVQRVQSDCLVLFLLAIFIYALFRRRQILAGLALASAVMVKLTPLIFLPYLLLRKKFKAAFACGLFTIFYSLLPAVYVGWARNFEYLKNFILVHQKNPADYFIWYKNQSLHSSLLRFFTSGSGQVSILNLRPSQVWIIFLILGASLFSLVFILCRKTRPQETPLGYLTEISLILVLMVILSPLAWKHSFIHLLIAQMVLLYYLFYASARDKVTWSLFLGSFLLNTILNPELTKSAAALIQEYSNVTFGALLIYAALLRVKCKLSLLSQPTTK